MLQSTKVRSRGISVLELLIGLGVLTVILSVSAPTLNKTTARADMQSALKNLELSIQLARSAARQLETDVVLHLETDPRARHHTITFSVPKREPKLNSVALFEDYVFPADIRLDAESNTVRFNYQGEIESPIKLRLVSNLDDNLTQRLLIR